MQITELAQLIDAKVLICPDTPREIAFAYTCDLLSWVMAKGKPGLAWVTVQTHMNVIAIASLHDIACIICPEGIQMEAPCVEKAGQEGIAVLSSEKTAYEICGLLYKAGVSPV